MRERLWIRCWRMRATRRNIVYKYMYLSEERSERTGGHLWNERVVETAMGKVRLLLAEDGKPLSAERQAAEKPKLEEIAAHPDEFQRREQAMKNDEEHAEQMLALLHKAFLFDEPQSGGQRCEDWVSARSGVSAEDDGREGAACDVGCGAGG